MSDPQAIRLFWKMKEWWEEGTDEDAERAICRAAAEISGLTFWGIVQAAIAWEDKFLTMAPGQRKSETAVALRRLAELMKAVDNE
jgi:hypothetical protein